MGRGSSVFHEYACQLRSQIRPLKFQLLAYGDWTWEYASDKFAHHFWRTRCDT
jgi:hypothetical protein